MCGNASRLKWVLILQQYLSWFSFQPTHIFDKWISPFFKYPFVTLQEQFWAIWRSPTFLSYPRSWIISCYSILTCFISWNHFSWPTIHHLTEAALVWVVNNLLSSCNRGQVSVLSVLDLSTAFDTLDHHILLQWLHNTFGLSGTVLGWLHFYLSARTQSVLHGVPQDSVLTPLLFADYVQPLLGPVTCTLACTPTILSFWHLAQLANSPLCSPGLSKIPVSVIL